MPEPTNSNKISYCLVGAIIFLALYLLFTSSCNKRDNYIQPSVQVLGDAYESIYPSAEDADYDYGYDEEDSPQYIDDNIYHKAERDGLKYHRMCINDSKNSDCVDRAWIYENLMTNKYNKEMRYC